VALNEPSSEGVSRALAESGRSKDVALIAVDQSFELVKRLEAGTIRELLVQQPFNMGYLGVQAARDLIDGRRVEPVIDTGSVDIDFKTLFQPRNQKLLFPFSDN
jgi:ribose transport system substrate-binding protein